MRRDPLRTSVHAGAPACALALLIAGTGAAPGGDVAIGRLPPIVFVARAPVPGDPGAIPGLGPHHRAVVTGGRLLVRERDGRVRELLPRDAFFDVSDPSVSPSARRIAFAAVTRSDGSWRIWMVDVDGGGLRQVTFDYGGVDEIPRIHRGGELFFAYPDFDDLDPCWIDDSTLVIASTRFPQRAQYADVRVTNLFRVRVASGSASRPERMTAERNGAEEPAMDWRSGRLLFSRWWFNRHRATGGAVGITTDPALAIPSDTVNLWQTMEMSPTVERPRLAAGELRVRRGTMGYQPAVLAGGAIAAVYAANLGLSPRPGGTGIHAMSRSFGPSRRLAGAIVSGREGDAYGGTEGLAPPAACSPAALADGRVLFSYAPGARGEFGLYVMRADGSGLRQVVDLPGTLELDAAPIVKRRAPPREPRLAAGEMEHPGRPGRSAIPRMPAPPVEMEDLRALIRDQATFRYHDRDVFGDGPRGSPARGAAARTAGARLRFFATLARPDRVGGDTAVLVREVAVAPNGAVDEPSLPADLPMFEQLVGPDGRVLMTAHGPAQVAGSNAGTAGVATRCVGCHLGHSTLPLEPVRARPGKGRK